MSQAPLIQRHKSLVACLIIALTATAGHWWICDLPLMGFDAYPLIASARVEVLDDFLRLFSMELMDGRYPDGHFYRPLVQLSFALDHAIHGLRPQGYHLTNLTICVASGLLLFGLARRITGIGVLGACLAGLLFVGHPLQAEVLPFPARRADNLALCMILAALSLQARPGARLSHGRNIACALLSWCAFGAKETGAVLALLAPLMAVMEATGSFRERLLQSARVVWPTLLGVSLGVIARQMVLGGLGGHSDSSLLGGLALPASEYLWRMIYSQPWLGWGEWALAIIWMLFATIVLGAWRTNRPGAGFLLSWLLALLAVSGLAGRVHEWYALLFVPPLAILVAAAIEGTWRNWRQSHILASAVPGVLALAGGTSLLVSGPLFQRYANLVDGAKMLDQSLVQVDRLLKNAKTGSTARLNPWIPILPPHSDGSELRGVALAADYSLKAYVELQRPELSVEVRRFESQAPSSSARAWTLELVQQPLPSWIRQH